MSPEPIGLRQRLVWFRDDFIEFTQRVYFRYDIDLPGVVTSILSVTMVGIALGFIYSVRNG